MEITNTQKQTCEKFLELARKEVGTTETPGPGNNPRVLEYHAVTKGGATLDSVPWCSAFVSWVIEQCGLPSTKSAWARSYLSWGMPIEEPIQGCVVVFKRNENSGHVGFFNGFDTNGDILVFGGNQDESVKVKTYKKSDLLGYRVPFVKAKLYADLVKKKEGIGEWEIVYREKLSDCKNNIADKDFELKV